MGIPNLTRETGPNGTRGECNTDDKYSWQSYPLAMSSLSTIVACLTSGVTKSVVLPSDAVSCLFSRHTYKALTYQRGCGDGCWLAAKVRQRCRHEVD